MRESVPDQVRILDTRKTAVRRIVMFDSVNIAGFESRHCSFSSVRLEQVTHNDKVAGSTPAGSTNKAFFDMVYIRPMMVS